MAEKLIGMQQNSFFPHPKKGFFRKSFWCILMHLNFKKYLTNLLHLKKYNHNQFQLQWGSTCRLGLGLNLRLTKYFFQLYKAPKKSMGDFWDFLLLLVPLRGWLWQQLAREGMISSTCCTTSWVLKGMIVLWTTRLLALLLGMVWCHKNLDFLEIN